MSTTSFLVLLRHGESLWNAEGRFTGWRDVELSPRGKDEARTAGEMLVSDGRLAIDSCHTSVLTRAIRTAEIALRVAGRSYVPVHRHWRLNERHYGALQGLDKRETTERYGADQVQAWRRGYDASPPPLAEDDPTHPCNDPRYRLVPLRALPATECLADVVARLVPYFEESIAPELFAGLTVLVSAHGNSLRAMQMYLEQIPEDKITSVEVPTGVPRVYELDSSLRVMTAEYLGDQSSVAEAADAVRRQADVR